MAKRQISRRSSVDNLKKGQFCSVEWSISGSPVMSAVVALSVMILGALAIIRCELWKAKALTLFSAGAVSLDGVVDSSRAWTAGCDSSAMIGSERGCGW